MTETTTTEGTGPKTDVYHEGDEVAVVARSKYSRTTHKPATDDDGNVIWYAPTSWDEDGPMKVVDEDHEEAEPKPVCGLPCGDVHETRFRLVAVDALNDDGVCSYCTGDFGDQAAGSANLTPARRLRYGDEWGQE